MKIAVIGAGAIGSLVAGYLKLKEADVSLIGRRDAVDAIRKNGIVISGVRGDLKVNIEAYELLVLKPDLVILATKTQDIERALRDNLALLKNTPVLTTQNGMQAEYITAKLLSKENIISSIVMFGATYLNPGRVTHNFEGDWIIGSVFKDRPNYNMVEISMVLDRAFSMVMADDILGKKYLKVFVNANNCIPAILGVSMQEAFSDPQISRISIALWEEAFSLLSKLGIGLSGLPGFPVENVTGLISMPKEKAALVFSGIMTKLSKDPLYGSILQSIMRGRSSEIDYINGEFVSLAERNKLESPINKKLVELVHKVEQDKRFLTKEELIDSLKGVSS